MKHFSIFLILLTLTCSCNSSAEKSNIELGNKKKNSLTEKSPKQKAKELKENYENALKANRFEKEKLNQIFFESFPNSFSEMYKYFGFDEKTHEDYLYSNGNEIIEYFSTLKLNNKEKYYNKYISICINGKWDADNIAYGFYIHKRILNDKSPFFEVLNKRTDSELKSVFKFMYDGPHPDNESNHKLNKKFMIEIPNKFERLKKIINYSLDELIYETKDKH